MDKVLIEIQGGTLVNLQSTNNDIQIHLIDHDFCDDGYPIEHVAEIYNTPVDYYSPAITADEFHKKIDSLIADMKKILEA